MVAPADLQGVWVGSTLTPLEPPAEYQGREFLSDEQVTALETAALVEEQRLLNRPAERAPAGGNVDFRPDGSLGYDDFWLDEGTTWQPSGRTALIVDPPSGRIPYTPTARDHERPYGTRPWDSHLDLDTGERCFGDGFPQIWFGDNPNHQIFQTPTDVVILHEMYHQRRIIPIDGRPRTGLPQWNGEPRGLWEGSTLVVESRHFPDRSEDRFRHIWRAPAATLHVVERFTRVDAETIDYEATITDPVRFAHPWNGQAVKTVAYLRVSTAQQDVRSQRLAILEYARKHDFRIDDFIEATASGQASEKRRRLDELMSVLQRGDRLVVSKLSRLGRSPGQIVAILDALAKAGVAFVALKENIRVEGREARHPDQGHDYALRAVRRGRARPDLRAHPRGPRPGQAFGPEARAPEGLAGRLTARRQGGRHLALPRALRRRLGARGRPIRQDGPDAFNEVLICGVLSERHHLDPSGISMLVEPLLDGGPILLRHVTDFPILDDRHCARDGVPRFPGTGRAVQDSVQGMLRPKGWGRRSGALRRPPDDGLSIQPSARPIRAASPRLFE